MTLGGPPVAAQVAQLSSCACARALAPADTDNGRGWGWRNRGRERSLGTGRARWRRARSALETAEGLELPWAKWWRSGTGSTWAAGDVLVVGARVLPAVWVANVNTVTHVERKRGRISVAWSTTSRHLLRGSETVAVERRADDIVFSVNSHSRPHHPAAWIAYPIVAFLQHRFTVDVCKRMHDITQTDDH